MHNLFIIDVTRGYLPAALLASAAYATAGSDVLFVQGVTDHEVVKQGVDRFRPTRILAMVGCAPPITLGRGGEDGLPLESLPHESAPLLSWLIHNAVEQAHGVVLFPAHSPSWAIKASALATRLGYLAWPIEEAAGFAYAAPPGVPVLVLGEAPGAVSDMLQGREFRHLPGDRAVVQFLRDQGLPLNYVVLVNSADLEPPAYTGATTGSYWTQGLSLLSPLLASYRDAVIIDARTPRADSREVERTLNQKLSDTGLKPEYLAILAAPGAIPYIAEPQMSFNGGEEHVRDLHVRVNQDLFFDCAEGRIFGRTAGGVSLQLLSTKHHAELQGSFREKALIFGRPHVEDGVIFAIDEAVGRTQLKPALSGAGLSVTELYGTECSADAVSRQLRDAGLAIYGGHGSPEALHTHRSPLYAEHLPNRIAPGVVYACACSTLYPRPTWHSADGGYSFEERITPFPEQIGPAFIDRGALAFVGGLTVEDVPLNTPMYAAFVQALVLKGLSVGQAVRAARNHTAAQVAILAQSSPEVVNDYRYRIAETLQQQAVLGDPAFAPYPGTRALAVPVKRSEGENAIDVEVAIPEKSWQRFTTPVERGPANREYHRVRNLEIEIPMGEDVYTWGENYTVATDATGQSNRGVVGGCMHLTADLPAGRAPVKLSLEAAALSDAQCLLCGSAQPPADGRERLNRFAVPFRNGAPPVRLDFSRGWGFVTEELDEGLRVHWLVPTLIIEDAARQAATLRSARFRLYHTAGVRAEGRLELGQGTGEGRAPGAMEGTRGHLDDDLLISFGLLRGPAEGPGAEPDLSVVAQTLSGPGGRWACWLPAGESTGVRVAHPMPLFRHAGEAVVSFTPGYQSTLQAGQGITAVPLKPVEWGVLRGSVVDAYTGKPLGSARVRLWRARSSGKYTAVEGYVGELKADAQGRFEFHVPTGSYMVMSAHRTEQRYHPGKVFISVFPEKESRVLVPMKPGALLTGHLSFKGKQRPKGVTLWLIKHGSADEEVLARGCSRRDGSYELLVPTWEPFDIRMHPEGFRAVEDRDKGRGYLPEPGETVERDYVLEPDA